MNEMKGARKAARMDRRTFVMGAAALGAAALAGGVYRDGEGNPVGSLGVHEHWNNAVERLYSRDRDEAEGIELVRILR